MTEKVLDEARTYMQNVAQRARERGQTVPTSGVQFERAVKTVARSFDQLHKAARLAERNAQSES
jgi:hypothetical protein